jgi:hypothetical protein
MYVQYYSTLDDISQRFRPFVIDFQRPIHVGEIEIPTSFVGEIRNAHLGKIVVVIPTSFVGVIVILPSPSQSVPLVHYGVYSKCVQYYSTLDVIHCQRFRSFVTDFQRLLTVTEKSVD